VASAQLRQDGARVPAPSGISKVPYRITAYFWTIKILTTAMGEALADFLAFRYSPVLAGVVGTLVFAVALVLQFRARRYRVWIYWFAVAMVAVWGTLAADGLHITLGVPYALSSAFFAACLVVVFVAWYATERTLSIHSITTPRRELFYWTTVLATFALGTAVGDLTGLTLHLGFFQAGLLFGAAIWLPLVAWRLGVNGTLCFWAAYVLTRPLGASFADWVGKDHSIGGGLGVGDVTVTGVLVVAIAALVTWAHRSGHDIQPPIDRDAAVSV
jgi:uncharacterized membrane-anchored protein